MLTQPIPDTVALRFHSIQPEPGEVSPLMVEAVDATTGDTVNLASRDAMRQWLDDNGYRCLLGTQGVWGRA